MGSNVLPTKHVLDTGRWERESLSLKPICIPSTFSQSSHLDPEAMEHLFLMLLKKKKSLAGYSSRVLKFLAKSLRVSCRSLISGNMLPGSNEKMYPSFTSLTLQLCLYKSPTFFIDFWSPSLAVCSSGSFTRSLNLPGAQSLLAKPLTGLLGLPSSRTVMFPGSSNKYCTL